MNIIRKEDLTLASVIPQFVPGTIYCDEFHNKEYRYVKLADDIDTKIGSPVKWYDVVDTLTQYDPDVTTINPFKVTANTDHGMAGAIATYVPVGVAMAVAVASTGEHLWIQTKGIAILVAGSEDVAAGDFVTQTADGVFDTQVVIGALADQDAGGAGAVGISVAQMAIINNVYAQALENAAATTFLFRARIL